MPKTYSTIIIGESVLVKPDGSKEVQTRIVKEKSGPNSNGVYCLLMDDGSKYYGRGEIELKT
jgi:hypothetical protein